MRSAIISGVYRYELVRSWDDDLPLLLWIMLNPSVADAHIDDPTVRRVVNFSKGFGFGSAKVINLFALRATSPGDLLHADDPVGPDNDATISRCILDADVAVCAWGAVHPKLRWRLEEVRPLLDGPWLKCLGLTARGDPRHPLYLARSSLLRPWRAAA